MLYRDVSGGDTIEFQLIDGTILRIYTKQRRGSNLRLCFDVPDEIKIVHHPKTKKAKKKWADTNL